MSKKNEKSLDEANQQEPQLAAMMDDTPSSEQDVENSTQPMAGRMRPRGDGDTETSKVSSLRTQE
jgi:hypothetical protein